MAESILSKISKVSFIDEPLLLSTEDYREGIREYLEKIGRHSNLVSVYQHGECKNPGISDIDLILVITDNLNQDGIDTFSIRNLSFKSRYIFSHEPVVVDEYCFKYQSAIFYFPDLTLLEGRDIQRVFYPEIMQQQFNLANRIDRLCCYALKINSLKNKNVWPIRTLLKLLKSIIYSIKDSEIITVIQNNKFQNYCELVQNLRSNWFKLSRLERKLMLFECLKEAEECIYHLIHAINEYLIKKGYVSSEANKHIIIRAQNTGSYVVFKPAFNKCSVEELHRLLHQFKKYILGVKLNLHRGNLIILPYSFYHQLSFYANAQSGPVSYAIKKWLNLKANQNFNIKSEYREILSQRIALMNQQLEFLNRNGFYFGSLFWLLVNTPYKNNKANLERKSLKYLVAKAITHFNCFALNVYCNLDEFLNMQMLNKTIKLTGKIQSITMLIFKTSRRKNGPEVLRPHPERIRQYEQHLEVGRRVLDIGTGTGVLAEMALKKGAKEVVAVDINPAAVEEASKRVPKAKVLLSGLFDKVEGVYDTIIFAAPWSEGEIHKPLDYAIYDCGVVDRFFREVKRYLKKGGYIWFQYSDAFVNKYNRLNTLLNENGFRVEGCWSYEGWGSLVKRKVRVFLYKISIDS